MSLDVTELDAAAARLRGHLVHCPVVGDLCLPGYLPAAGLRLKAELLQPGGSLWYRGAQHWLLRQLGRWKGLRLDGAPRTLLAWARAARDQRMPMVARAAAAGSAEFRRALEHLGAEVVEREGAASAGYVQVPDAGDADVVLGVASLVYELRDELPSDTRRVVVAPAVLAPAVAVGVDLLGLRWQVIAAPPVHPDAAGVAAALRAQHRLAVDAAGGAAVAAAMHDEATCVVLGE